MHRNYIKSLLLKYQPTAYEELGYKQHMLEFINTCENCFDRSCMPGHFTGSSLLLNKAGTQCLLMHHTKLNKWLQLGGHCDGDSNILNVAIKEAQEESGINNISPISEEIFDIDMHMIPQVKQDAPHYHFDVRFLLQVTSDEVIVQNSESLELRWFDLNLENLPTKERSVTRMIDKLVAMKSKQPVF